MTAVQIVPPEGETRPLPDLDEIAAKLASQEFREELFVVSGLLLQSSHLVSAADIWFRDRADVTDAMRSAWLYAAADMYRRVAERVEHSAAILLDLSVEVRDR